VALDKNGKPAPVHTGQAAELPFVPAIQVEKIAGKTLPCQPIGERIVALKKVMMPNETNGMGNIFGGLLLTYMDWAGSYVARRSCKNHIIARCVTRFMDKIEFREPVHVNDVLTCYGSVSKIGTTSVSVHVEVEVDRDGQIIPVTRADLVFVAVNKKGKKVVVDCAAHRKRSQQATKSAVRKNECN
jgi:acyl-CoA thioesterase YciA